MNPTLEDDEQNDERRDPRTGRFLPGNRACPPGHLRAETHGVLTYERRGILPDEIRESERAFYTQVIADLGGIENIGAIKLGYVNNLARLHSIIELLSAYLQTNGVLTPRGRQRSTVGSLLTALASFDRLAGRLGLERLQRNVRQTLDDVLNTPDDDDRQSER